MDQHVFAGLHFCKRYQHVPCSYGHQWQRRRFFPTQHPWFWNDVYARHGNKLCITSVTPVANNVVFGTRVVLSAQTSLAVSARDARMQHYFIAGLDPVNNLSGLENYTRNIVAQNVRQRNIDVRQSAAHPNVEVVQGTRANFNQNFVGLNFWFRYVCRFQHIGPAVLAEYDCLHSRDCTTGATLFFYFMTATTGNTKSRYCACV